MIYAIIFISFIMGFAVGVATIVIIAEHFGHEDDPLPPGTGMR